MGIAASLFFTSNDTEKQTLHRRITPSEEQMDEQIIRWNELSDHLMSDLRSRSGHPIRTWLQGSYKYATQIRPPSMGEEFDIDLGVFYCWPGKPEDGSHGPVALREMAQNSMLEYAKTAAGVKRVAVPPKPRCMRIHYDGGFHIDVPTYHLDQDADARTLACEHGWEISDPKAIYLWFQKLFEEGIRTKVRRHIRYTKCWAGLKWTIGNGRPSSVLLTVLVADACVELGDDAIGPDDDTLLAILQQISTRIQCSSVVENPANRAENLNRLSDKQWSDFCAGVNEFVAVAAKACNAPTALDAVDHWAKAFKHFFPMVEQSALAEDAMAKSTALVSVSQPEVMVDAVARDNKHLTFAGHNCIGPIPKGCDVHFRLLNPERLPVGSTVEWVVRNEGAEAENINDLGHSSGFNYKAKDHSAYAGTHFMDCIIRLNGRVYSVRRIPVTIIGMAAPRRNPLTKPYYVRLRGRK
jgi:hypothetical protein